MTTYAQLASFLPRPYALRVAALVEAVRAAATRSSPGRAVAFRNVDAVDGLDERMLRDIGAGGWTAGRDTQRDRDALRVRLDAEFRG